MHLGIAALQLPSFLLISFPSIVEALRHSEYFLLVGSECGNNHYIPFGSETQFAQTYQAAGGGYSTNDQISISDTPVSTQLSSYE
jgi:hypothetical protein